MQAALASVALVLAGCAVQTAGGMGRPVGKSFAGGDGTSLTWEVEARARVGGNELGAGFVHHAYPMGNRSFGEVALATTRYRRAVGRLGAAHVLVGGGAGLGSGSDGRAAIAFVELALRFDLGLPIEPTIALRDTTLISFEGASANDVSVLAGIALPIDVTTEPPRARVAAKPVRRPAPPAPRPVRRLSGLGGRIAIGIGVATRGGSSWSQGGVELALTHGWGRHEVALAASADALGAGGGDGDSHSAEVLDLRYRIYGSDAPAVYAGFGVGGGRTGHEYTRYAALAIVAEAGCVWVRGNVAFTLGIRDLGLIGGNAANVLQLVGGLHLAH
jgi:hypothetical protein